MFNTDLREKIIIFFYENILKISNIIHKWMSEWLLSNANSEIFQLYHGENKLIFNEMMMRFAL
jgi:hypothetical protein